MNSCAAVALICAVRQMRPDRNCCIVWWERQQRRSCTHNKGQMSKEFKEIKENSEAKRGLGWRPNGAMAWDSAAPFFLPTMVPCAMQAPCTRNNAPHPRFRWPLNPLHSTPPVQSKTHHRQVLYFILVMATLAKRKRTKASIMVFSSISKRSEHLR